MDEIFGFLVSEILLQFVVEAVLEILIELGWVTARISLGRRAEVPVAASLTGLLLIGAALGGVSLWALPYRVTGEGPFRGASLVVSPVLNGLVMDAYGRWRRRDGKPATHASTFRGGAAFAIGIALVRFLFVPGFPPLPVER